TLASDMHLRGASDWLMRIGLTKGDRVTARALAYAPTFMPGSHSWFSLCTIYFTTTLTRHSVLPQGHNKLATRIKISAPRRAVKCRAISGEITQFRMANTACNTSNIEAFNPQNGPWTEWWERLEAAIQIYNVSTENQTAYLLHHLGASAYSVLKNEVMPQKPSEMTYKNLTETLEKFYEPKPLEIAENFKLASRKQQEGESILEYATALKKLSTNCKLGEHTEKTLRNYFVFGLRNKRTLNRLLETTDLTLEKAIQVATTMELSEKGTKQLQGEEETTLAISTRKTSASTDKFKKRGNANAKNSVAKNGARGKSVITCYRCGGSHYASACTLDRSMKCLSCGKAGHLKKVCKSSRENNTKNIEVLAIEQLRFRKKFFATLNVNNKDVRFEVDSGSAVTLMSLTDAKRLFKGERVFTTDLNLMSYTRTPIPLCGYIEVRVKNDIQARLNVKRNTNPVFHKPRPVPFRLRNQIEEELETLTQNGILEKVDFSEWATPIVPVIKKNGEIRVCGDYSVTLNPNLNIDSHPLPTPDELLTQMAGEKVFSKIDLLQAYLQLEVRQQDRELLTLNTHKGLYRPTRLMYGVASAPAIWQRIIENILKDIPGVVVFLDDIRVSGKNVQDHLSKLRQVFTRLQKCNIRINVKKSEFFKDQIQYCGYVIDKNGINKAPDKIDAISNMPQPTNLTELRSFLGMIRYYDRFVPNLSAILQPLNNLLQKNVKFYWSEDCEKSFQAAKRAFTSPKCLAHFDPRLPITLATDASPYGIGAVLSHIYPDGSERAIQYASQTLSKTQRSYSQIDKEALAIIFGVRKFHQYLQSTEFTLITDHRPLTQIFSPTKGLPIYTAMRMQHYALILQGFCYKIKYRKSKLHSNADCLSRLPIPRNTDEIECEAVDEFQEATFDTLPITAAQVAAATREDKELSNLLKFLITGSNSNADSKSNKYYTVPYEEFSLLHGVIFRGHRVVIPIGLQKKILHELHLGHFGTVKMKHLARGYVWWNKIDNDIKKLTQNCHECNSHRNNPPKVSNHVWEPAQLPFERVHVDFAGPFLGHNFFILVDSYTKWPEIHIVKDITTKTTINVCRQIFYTYGLPKYIVSDNGTAFTSKEFRNFLDSHDDGRVWKRHINQMRPIGDDTPKSSDEDFYDFYDTNPPNNCDNANNNTSSTNNNISRNASEGIIVNASPSQASTSTNSSSQTLVNASGNTTPTSPGPSYSTLTAPKNDSSIFSTPQGSWCASTPKLSSPTSLSGTPEAKETTPSKKGASRPQRQIRSLKYLQDYET
ncbi:uncharacterized protein K02A2.6-like, partial [Temnothorax curvispinosus]|uniref:RNA-directed DNA polymerase n=1 Tax=Temnothorax curvispinosus TaxID=300111 RepID=A0A6J1RIQ5_9HYME